MGSHSITPTNYHDVTNYNSPFVNAFGSPDFLLDPYTYNSTNPAFQYNYIYVYIYPALQIPIISQRSSIPFDPGIALSLLPRFQPHRIPAPNMKTPC
ncbi:hypothetical protein E2P81_ATG02206 [Venturia nashicola]|uniref:Uncharacterized protein n=1 Tax=Venturia nashicola TaxID=86259 RepID=A0A4Z1P8E7_9PEZI|nr:hypothetical protein E6O75_ATG02263 [Venturia nashicola]TLD35903.1 hypothetical protein E2P81_ATG02206 [Venturia nashicola]